MAAINSGKDMHCFMAADCSSGLYSYDVLFAAKCDKLEQYLAENPQAVSALLVGRRLTAHLGPQDLLIISYELTAARSGIKSVTFGIPYGAGPETIGMMIRRRDPITGKYAETLEEATARAEKLMEAYFQKAYVLKQFLDEAKRDGIRFGLARSPKGRIRWMTLPDRSDPDYKKRIGKIGRWSSNHMMQCVSGETRLFLEGRGMVRIQDFAGEPIRVWDGSQFSNARVAAAGERRLIRVTLSGDYQIECSPDHKLLIATPGGKQVWKTAAELMPKMTRRSTRTNYRVVLSGPIEPWAYPTTIPPAPKTGSNNGKYIDVATLADDYVQMGEWLGRLASDGNVGFARPESGYVKLRVADHESCLFPFLFRASQKVNGGVQPSVEEDWDGSIRIIKVWSSSLANQLTKAGIETGNMRIPDFVWSRRDLLAGYLRGVFDGDGTVNPNNIVLTAGKSELKEGWFREIQEALLLFGIRSHVGSFDNGVGQNGNVQTRRCLSVQKYDVPVFAREIGFLNSLKQYKAELVVGDARKGTAAYGRARAIKRIEDTGLYVPMYDVVDSETERFAANGMVVHNSGCVDLLKPAGARAYRALRGGVATGPVIYPGARVMLSAHDELILTAPEEHAEAVAEVLREAMTWAYNEIRLEIRGKLHCLSELKNNVKVLTADYWVKD